MHNWSLLIVAFLAVFHPIASFTERSLVDGREQCCDLKSHRDTRLLYGTDIRNNFLPDNRLLNQARSERRYVVRDKSVLYRPVSDRADLERRLATRIDSTQSGYRFERVIENQRLTRHNSRRTEPRDTERRVGNDEHVRLRQLDERRDAREYSDASSSRLRDTTRLSRQRVNENMDSLAGRELQRIRDLSRENIRHRHVRDTRDILQRTRDDLTRAVLLNYRNDQRLVRERFDGQRNVLSRHESRDVAGDERRYTQHSESRFSGQIEEANRFDSRVNSRVQIYNDRQLRSLDGTESRRILEVRDNTEVRRSMIRSTVNDETRRHTYLDHSDRRLYREDNQRISLVSRNERSDNKRELDLLAHSERRASRSAEHRFEAKIENNNRERRSLSLSDRRLLRERKSTDRQRDLQVRNIREDSPMSRESFERHQHRERREYDRSDLRSRSSELRDSTRRMEARIRQVERSTNSRVTRDISERDVSRNRDSFERRMDRSTSTDRLTRDLTRETRQNARERTEPIQMDNRREMSRKEIRYQLGNARNRDLMMTVSPKSYYSYGQISTSNWQYLIYTIQAIYLCSMLFNAVSDNGAGKEKSRFSWWKMPSQNLVKLD